MFCMLECHLRKPCALNARQIATFRDKLLNLSYATKYKNYRLTRELIQT